MFKSLSEKKKQKYVELARVARENYKNQVQEFKEAYPDTNEPVETPEKMKGPPAPTPFFMFCTVKRKQRQSMSWCENKFPSLSDKERLKWVDLAIAHEASYLAEFEKFKSDNPHLKPKLNPVLNEEEKLLVYMRDAKPVMPPYTGRSLFASECPTNKDVPRSMESQWNDSWNALSMKKRKVYQEKVVAMKYEYTTKLAAYLSNLPADKRWEEMDNCLFTKRIRIRKKRAEKNKSTKKASDKSEEENESSILPNVGSKKTPTSVKGNKSSSSAVDSDNIDDVTLSKKMLTSSPNSGEESSEESAEESDFQPRKSNFSKKKVPKLPTSNLSALAKKTKFGTGNPSPRPDTSSSTNSESKKMSRVSSNRSGKKVALSLTEHSEIRSEEESDSSEKEDEESIGLKKKSSARASSSKTKNGLSLNKKSTSKSPSKTSRPIDSSEESDDNVKLSFYLPKFPTGKNHREISKCLPDAKGMKRKKGAEMDKSKPAFRDENDSDFESEDVTQPKKKRISRKSAKETSEESSKKSDFDPEQSVLPKKRGSMLDATKFAASNSIKKAKFSIVNPSSRSDLNGSDPSSPSSSDDEPQETNRSSSSSFESGKQLALSVTKRNAVQNEEDTSEEYDSSEEEDELSGLNDSFSNMAESKARNEKSTLDSLPKTSDAVHTSDEFDSDDTVGESLSKKEQVAPKSANKSSDESSDDSGSQPEQSSLPKKSVSTLVVKRKKNSSSSVRPLWASQQKLYKNEPPKPPKTAAEWHAFEICKVSNISEKKKKDLWNGLSEKRRRKLKMKHTERLEEYEEKLQAFKKGLSKKELQAYERIKRSQPAASVIE